MPFKIFPEAINQLKLFRGIPETVRNNLIQEGKIKYLSQGDLLFRQGDPIRSFYIICRGTVKLVKETAEGKEITTNITTSGNTIGKSEIFRRVCEFHSVSTIAISDVAVLEFNKTWLHKVANIPTVALNIISNVSEYAHMTEVESEQKNTMSVTQRLGCLLQRICVVHNFDPISFELPYSKGIIASRLGMERETLSRSFAKLKDYGIDVNNNHVSFTDIENIERHICSHCSIVDSCETHLRINALREEDVS